MATSDFELKPLRVALYEGTAEDMAAVPAWPQFANQREPASFRNSKIKADRKLTKVAGYAPEFTNYPLVRKDVPIDLTAEEYASLQALKATGHYGTEDGAVLRYVLFSWWIENFMQGPKHFDDLKA
jgi:hypothetical protein